MDSITTAEVVDPEMPSSSFKRVNSYHKAGLFLHGEGTNEVEPYAWLSQTAPASPLHGRSRSGSQSGVQGEYMFYLDSDAEEGRKSRGSGQFTSFLLGKFMYKKISWEKTQIYVGFYGRKFDLQRQIHCFHVIVINEQKILTFNLCWNKILSHI